MTAFPTVPTQQFIAGAWRDGTGDSLLDVIDPATEKTYRSIKTCSAADVDEAVDAAVGGMAKWKSTDAWTRSAVLRRAGEILHAWAPKAGEIMTSEQGKPLRESTAEWHATADQFDWYADETRRNYGRLVDGHHSGQRIMVRHEPVGIVAAFASWNFPALLPSRKIAPALAAGCAVIAKPAEESPLSTLLVAEACRLAGVPAGAVSMLVGDPEVISTRLIGNPLVRKVSLTGSVPVGRTLMRQAADSLTPVSLELGGHAPVLVFGDADPVSAAQLLVASKFRNAGQVCASPSRFLVHQSIADTFVDAFADAASQLTLGPGLDDRTDVGPLTTERRLDAAAELVEDAVSRGAALRVGGRRAGEHAIGYFFEPTVLVGVDTGAAIMNEEPFAPVAPIVTFETLDEALSLANSTEFGLASYVFTKDLATAHLAAENIAAGMVAVNTTYLATAEAPFGGVKSSGFGREGGAEGILDYSTAKYINVAIA